MSPAQLPQDLALFQRAGFPLAGVESTAASSDTNDWSTVALVFLHTSPRTIEALVCALLDLAQRDPRLPTTAFEPLALRRLGFLVERLLGWEDLPLSTLSTLRAWRSVLHAHLGGSTFAEPVALSDAMLPLRRAALRASYLQNPNPWGVFGVVELRDDLRAACTSRV